MDTKQSDVIIIGAGASGLIAANIAVERGKTVILLEKKSQMGLKLRITGKGHCNITNNCDKQSFLSHISNKDFFLPAFEKFSNKDLIDFFSKRNVSMVVERGERVYPESKKALDVFLCLIKDLENNDKVTIKKDCKVEKLIIKDNCVVGVKTNQGEIFANNVILATGGNTYQTTGSCGDGYKLAKQANHNIIRPLPILVGLRTKEGYERRLQDFEVKNCEVRIEDKLRNIVAKEFGDIYLDEYGVSGPIILTLSRLIAQELDKEEQLYLIIDYKPKISEEKLYLEIQNTVRERRIESIGSVLRKWFAKDMVNEVADKCRLNARSMAKNITEKDMKNILWYMKQRRQEIIGDMGWNEAIVTKGGVSLEEIDSKTMKSKKVNNLYFCGEVIDLDADTGGFNLQIAFSTGVLSASSID